MATHDLPVLVPSQAPARLVAPDEPLVRIDLDAYCWTCNHRHRLGRTPQSFAQEVWEWQAKHPGHAFEFLSPSRRLPRHLDETPYRDDSIVPWWLTVRENANVKLAYAASAAMTITLASLASSSTFLVGQESTAIVNTTDLYVDGRIMVKITTSATAPTVDTEIRIYGVQPLDDTPTWPDTMTGTNAGRTVTNAYILDSAFILLGATAVSATAAVGYPIRTLTLAEAFGFVPKRFSVYVTHNTVQALHATAGNHSLVYIGAYLTST
jgi:hypothetical protein